MKLRVVVLTMEEPFYLPLAIRGLLRRRPGEVALVAAADPPSSASLAKEARRQLGVLGPVTFARRTARWLGRRVHDRVFGGTSLARPYSVRAVARREGVEYARVEKINGAPFLERLRALAPDVVVSVSCPQIFRRELLSVPRLGCINVHNAPLPRYKGMLPSFWVLYNGEAETGVTVHRMDETIDTGPILVQRMVPILPGETQHSLLLRTKGLCGEVVDEALELLALGRGEGRRHDPSEGSYFSFPTPVEAAAFRARGGRWE